MRIILLPLAVIGLAACAPTIPDSGVGFDDYDAYREAQLRGNGAPATPTSQTIRPPAPDAAPEGDVAAVASAAIDAAEGAEAPASPVLDRNNPGISSEQDFDAVASERDIQADAARIAAARQQYVLVQPTELQRTGDTGPNIIQYALSTSHPVGTKKHRRGNPFARARVEQKCAGYRTPDTAQEDFLAAGGPERDRLGIDPDGDGYACSWDPATYRTLVRN